MASSRGLIKEYAPQPISKDRQAMQPGGRHISYNQESGYGHTPSCKNQVTGTNQQRLTKHGGNHVPESLGVGPSNRTGRHGGGHVPASSHVHMQEQPQYNTAGQEASDAQKGWNLEQKQKQVRLQVYPLTRQGGFFRETNGKYYEPPRTPQIGYWNINNSRNCWRWKHPHLYQEPGVDSKSAKQHHRDMMRRDSFLPATNDQYLSPTHGCLSTLVVQVTDAIYSGPGNSTWRRTFIRNVGPKILRLAIWVFDDVDADYHLWSVSDWLLVGGKWFLSIFGLYVLLSNPSTGGVLRNFGGYDAILYKWWGYPKAGRNQRENDPTLRKEPATQVTRLQQLECGELQQERGPRPENQHEHTTENVGRRILQPRCLCFLDQQTENGRLRTLPLKVKDYVAQHGLSTHPEYLFLCYTSEQFGSHDNEALARLAETATRDAGLSAYWIGSSCMNEAEELEEDVYRISDVVRGAAAVTIIVGHPVEGRDEVWNPDQLLIQLGTRMWTLPEILLSPNGLPIRVYTRGLPGGMPREIAKRDFARLVWHDDASISRQLIDHYEGSLILSPLELVIIALQCLKGRNTTSHLPGDLSYALMGLLRRRPKIDISDSALQAFARLSLANDSNMLLERLLCIHPISQSQGWLMVDDFWGSQLWDIYPTCQIAGVGHNDTVILDGAYGAAIRWKSFASLAYTKRMSWKRLMALILLHSSPISLSTAFVFLIYTNWLYFAIILFIFSVPALLASPYLVRLLHGGKLWATQAWIFGFEGYMDLPTIERHIFGACHGALTWSVAGSTLSKHYKNRFHECVGLDPTSDPDVRRQVLAAQNGRYGDPKIFTIVDTNTMQVTMFSAVRPPVAALLCGSEGGMQRALMCSYDSKTQTFYRETVLRMETPVIQKMSRMRRFQFGFNRPL